MWLKSIEASLTHETLLELFGYDYKKAYGFFSLLREKFDLDSPLPAYSNRAASVIGIKEEDINFHWRGVRAAYDKIRAPYEIIDEKSVFFSSSLTASEFPVPFLYAVGNLSLLSKPRLTVLGTLAPSGTGVELAADAADFAFEKKLVLFCPLMVGISSLAMAEMLKKSGNVIAFSSQFPTKAPNEQLKAQMVDIMKRGGLIISPFGPAAKMEKWHQVIRNRAIGVLSDKVFLVEEKDGGPAWRIFDSVDPSSSLRLVSSHMINRSGYSFVLEHIVSGALQFDGKKDFKKLLSPKVRATRGTGADELTLDLF